MDIPVQSDIHIGVAQYLAETLDLEASFHAPGGEGVSQGVIISRGQAAGGHIFFEPVLQRAGLHGAIRATREDIGSRFGLESACYIHQRYWQGNVPDGTLAL